MARFEMINNLIELDSKDIFDEIDLFNELKNIDEIENCEELILSNNNLTRLIPDLKFLRNLKHLDLENNPIDDFSLLLISLKTLKNLESLKITLHKPEDNNLFLSSLTNLRIFNGKQLKEDSNDQKIKIDLESGDIEDSSFTAEQQRYNHLFTKINEKVKTQGRDAVNSFYSEYQKLVEEHTEKIAEASKTTNRVKYHQALCSAKYAIFNYFMEKLLEINDKKDKDLTNLMKEAFSGVTEAKTTNSEILDKILTKIESCERIMIKKIDDAKRINNASAEYDKLSQRYKNIKLECETYVDELNLMRERFNSLEKENVVLTDKILKLTKDLADTQQSKGSTVLLASPDKFKAYYNMARIASPKKNIKILTKKNMHDLIESIYESKSNYDKKCIEIRMPRETMEQHMYTFLNQKFGLKNLIVEWATSIINGIKMYANEDSDICLFGKILRNEIEEDFRTIFKKLKSSIFDLLIVSYY